MNSTGFSASYYSEYTVNVTSSISVAGHYTPLNESLSQVSLSCVVLNEGKPAQAENFVIYYEQSSPQRWVQAASPSTTDYGNGTYVMSFTSENATLSFLPVSVQWTDSRGISVWANATCTLE